MNSVGCGDNSCIFNIIKKKGGQHTNGGCRCFKELERWLPDENRWNREEVNKVRQDVQQLVNELRKTTTQIKTIHKLCEDKLAYGEMDDTVEDILSLLK